jgi:hypothetical protein
MNQKVVILVLGSSDSDHMKSRLDRTIEMCNRLINMDNITIILSGGATTYFDRSTMLTEADIMELYLFQHDDNIKNIVTIIKESKSLDTIGNIKYSATILKKLFYHKLYLVTSDYHIKRTTIICDHLIKNNSFIYVGSLTDTSMTKYNGLIFTEDLAIEKYKRLI